MHDFRKAMKRWRALLRLLEPLLAEEDKALRPQARDLARGLAHARDARAALDALEDTSKENALSQRTLATLRERLGDMRRRAERGALRSRQARTVARRARNGNGAHRPMAARRR